jgi:3-hydroxyisobutyrate dehydrogenase/glyoxylate/succinic semialdehyde reductase
MKIGFIGLGLMGVRMANNLLDNGNELIVYNRTKDKAETLIKKGAVIAESPSEVGKQVNIIFTMLSDPSAVEEVAFGENGFLNKFKQNSLWIDCSTVNPSFTKSTAAKVKKLNLRFIDAPVAGTTIPAEKGELIFFVGGDKKDVEEVKPLFEVMGKKILHLGANGKGTSMKMVINLILGQAMIAFSEGLVLGESLGFTKEELYNILLGGPVVAPFLTGKKDKIAKNNFEPEFPLQWMFKDFQLASLTGYENNVALPMTNQAKELYSLAIKYGFGEKDFSSIYNFLSGKLK